MSKCTGVPIYADPVLSVCRSGGFVMMGSITTEKLQIKKNVYLCTMSVIISGTVTRP
jgi:hypothetical protein